MATAAGESRAADMTADIRCLLTMGALSNSPKHKNTASLASFYFAGRLAVQRPDFDYAKDLKAEALRMKRDDYVQEAARCTASLNATIEALSLAQQSLKDVVIKP